MLLASNNILAVEVVVKQLVASGIPIALQKLSDIPSYLEIWIQRDSDFALARTLLPGRASSPVAVQPFASPVGPGGSQPSVAPQQAAPEVSSATGRSPGRLGWMQQVWHRKKL